MYGQTVATYSGYIHWRPLNVIMMNDINFLTFFKDSLQSTNLKISLFNVIISILLSVKLVL
jgi:hypothetical protein